MHANIFEKIILQKNLRKKWPYVENICYFLTTDWLVDFSKKGIYIFLSLDTIRQVSPAQNMLLSFLL